MGQPQHQELKDLARLAALTARVVAVAYGVLASSLERRAQEGFVESTNEDDSVIGEPRAAFQVMAGHVEQIRTHELQLDRLSGQD